MMIENKTTLDSIKVKALHPSHIKALDHPMLGSAKKVGRFILHLMEMLLSMLAGMPLLILLENLVPVSSPFAAAFRSGTNLYDFNHAIFMTVPMVTWMMVRRHGWQHSAEMAVAMLAPVAASIGLSLLGAETYLPWLEDASHPAMLLGMLLAMLYRREHYTGNAGHPPPIT
jgi:hypothetical protein